MVNSHNKIDWISHKIDWFSQIALDMLIFDWIALDMLNLIDDILLKMIEFAQKLIEFDEFPEFFTTHASLKSLNLNCAWYKHLIDFILNIFTLKALKSVDFA